MQKQDENKSTEEDKNKQKKRYADTETGRKLINRGRQK